MTNEAGRPTRARRASLPATTPSNMAMADASCPPLLSDALPPLGQTDDVMRPSAIT
jgi:hypothetical protein